MEYNTKYIPIREASKISGICAQTLRKLCDDNKIKHYKTFSGQRKIDINDLTNMFNKNDINQDNQDNQDNKEDNNDKDNKNNKICDVNTSDVNVSDVNVSDNKDFKEINCSDNKDYYIYLNTLYELNKVKIVINDKKYSLINTDAIILCP